MPWFVWWIKLLSFVLQSCYSKRCLVFSKVNIAGHYNQTSVFWPPWWAVKRKKKINRNLELFSVCFSLKLYFLFVCFMSIHRSLSELWFYIVENLGFPGGTRGKEPSCHFRRCKKHGLNPWVGKISWRRAQQPTPVFLPWIITWTEEPGGLQSMESQSQTWLKPLSMCALWNIQLP